MGGTVEGRVRYVVPCNESQVGLNAGNKNIEGGCMPAIFGLYVEWQQYSACRGVMQTITVAESCFHTCKHMNIPELVLNRILYWQRLCLKLEYSVHAATLIVL